MAHKGYGIYPHAECGQTTGRGYVVRPGTLKDYPHESGLMERKARFTVSDSRNYGKLSPESVYLRESDANRRAAALNGDSPTNRKHVKHEHDPWAEYDMAAKWCAERGVKGEPGDALPMCLSGAAWKLIDDDPEAFQERVRLTAYALAMANQPEY